MVFKFPFIHYNTEIYAQRSAFTLTVFLMLLQYFKERTVELFLPENTLRLVPCYLTILVHNSRFRERAMPCR